MASINAFTGVGVAGMSRTLHVATAAHAAAHPAFMAPATAYVGLAAADIAPQRKRRAANPTGASVDWGIT